MRLVIFIVVWCFICLPICEGREPVIELNKDSILHVAEDLFNQEKYHEVIEYLGQFVQDDLGIDEFSKDAYYLLSRSYAREGHFKEANHHFLSYMTLKDSVLKAKNRFLVLKLKKKYNDQIIEKEIVESEIRAYQNIKTIDNRNLLIYIILIFLASILFLGIFMRGMYRKDAKIQDQKLAQLKHQESIDLIEFKKKGEDKERIQIAKYLQSGIGINIGEIKANFKNLQKKHPQLNNNPDFEDTVQIIEMAEEQLESSLSSLRTQEFDLMKEINTLIKTVHKNIKITLEVDDGFSKYKDKLKDQSVIFYRIIQELIHNVLKHSKATEVIISLSIDENYFQVGVNDNGIGIDLTQIGFGLTNIKRIVEDKKGEVEILNEEGTKVSIKLLIPDSKFVNKAS